LNFFFEFALSRSHRVVSEEVFSSALGVMKFRTPEEAFERANHIRQGWLERRLD